MPRKRTADNELVAISAADMARFHRNASAALERRGAGYLAESLAGSLELIAMGGIPIVGMLWFGWLPLHQLVFLVASLWVGMLCDFARLALAGRGVKQFVDAHYDDWHVWVVVQGLRSGKNEAPRSHIQAKHHAGDGVFVDLAAGGFSTAIMAAAIIGSRGAREDFDRSFAVSLALMTVYQVAASIWEITRHRWGDASGPVQATPGARGVGLFILMFLTMTVGDPDAPGGLAARRVMLSVNGLILAIGALNSASVIWLRQETLWLRKYLVDNRAKIEEAGMAAKEGKRAKKKNKRK